MKVLKTPIKRDIIVSEVREFDDLQIWWKYGHFRGVLGVLTIFTHIYIKNLEICCHVLDINIDIFTYFLDINKVQYKISRK